ncbi:MAG: glycine cleavage T C-terminal barrel domain-containing protein [Planctomycetota bacterium]
MAHVSPLRDAHALAEASLRHYGPIDSQVELVETFGELDFEYAAIRKACVLIDQPHRATIEIVGDDRLAFLNNMITQEVGKLAPGRVARSFWLGRNGRIVGDLRLAELGDRMLVDLDVHAVESVVESLGAYVITEDVEIRDVTDRMHRLALHGPTSIELLAGVSEPAGDRASPIGDLADRSATVVSIDGVQCVVERCDSAGEVGLEITIETDRTRDVYRRLVETGQPHDEDAGNGSLASRVKLRPSGWLAYNTARIEAGTALFNLDFSSDSLPAETGEQTLNDRVSFTKGCFLGQEVVARMHARGQAKQRLVGLRPIGENLRDAEGFPRQPVGGTQVFAKADPEGDPVGIVTSSTISPMCGGESICFAMLRSKFAEDGASVALTAEGARLEARVQTDLRFLPR